MKSNEETGYESRVLERGFFFRSMNGVISGNKHRRGVEIGRCRMDVMSGNRRMGRDAVWIERESDWCS